MFTTTARLKGPVGVLGSKLLAIRDESTEFGVQKVPGQSGAKNWPYDGDDRVETGLWVAIDGPCKGYLLKTDLLDFSLPQKELPCTVCGEFLSVGLSVCVVTCPQCTDQRYAVTDF